MTITLSELLALESVVKEERKNEVSDNLNFQLRRRYSFAVTQEERKLIDNKINELKIMDKQKYQPVLNAIERKKQVLKSSLISLLDVPVSNPANNLESTLESCERNLLDTALNAIKKHD